MFDGKKITIHKEIKEEDLDKLKSIGRLKSIYWEGNKGASQTGSWQTDPQQVSLPPASLQNWSPALQHVHFQTEGPTSLQHLSSRLRLCSPVTALFTHRMHPQWPATFPSSRPTPSIPWLILWLTPHLMTSWVALLASSSNRWRSSSKFGFFFLSFFKRTV